LGFKQIPESARMGAGGCDLIQLISVCRLLRIFAPNNPHFPSTFGWHTSYGTVIRYCVIYCVKFLKSTHTKSYYSQIMHSGGKTKGQNFLNHPVHHRHLCRN